ncbi:hypothetical protein CH330_05140 [candidate division WOR-3 bacterium JGI_Cruoil_03_51_56]|mgnify:CR=1 FL=1|uniref:Putative zinc-finger domain-containing protein n=1 Tax=candidate division WOR-3 bacterium JGI_Cruoil_03_51_56 TaxID=1973747 RepID=A0A235BU97_UNCW3|nr:MAG: hypothetical protein CH330_05140 [candidate division WOR-3 bacterium JGI_Cruoil_03_51_56]
MINCSEVKRLLPAYLDREITGPNRDAITRHLEICETCRQELEALNADIEGLRSVKTPEPSPYFVTRTMAQIQQTESATRGFKTRRTIGRVLTTAAAVVLIAVGIWFGAMLGNGIAESGNKANRTDEWPFETNSPSFAEVYETMFAGE